MDKQLSTLAPLDKKPMPQLHPQAQHPATYHSHLSAGGPWTLTQAGHCLLPGLLKSLVLGSLGLGPTWPGCYFEMWLLPHLSE